MTTLITKLSSRMMISTLGLIVLGMLMGNTIFIYLGLIPIVYLAAGLYIQSPNNFHIETSNDAVELQVDDYLELERTIKVEKGVGPVLVYEVLPPEFRINNGSNINVYWKKSGMFETKYKNIVECTHRGIYEIGSIQVKGIHPFYLLSPTYESYQAKQELVVKPKPSKVKRVRRRRQYNIFPIPSEAKIKLGVQTSDFKEIRKYSHGDPYKYINWKATARINTIPGVKPAVNEYEREGRRVTWIFLDRSPRLQLGNTIKDSFEYAVQAATSLSEYYIERQCRVGFADYVTDPLMDTISPWLRIYREKRREEDSGYAILQRNILFPEAGNMQLNKIQRRLIGVETGLKGMNLLQVIRTAKGHIYGTNPLFIIITNVNQNNLDSLSSSIRELLKYTIRLRSQKTNIMIINISGYRLASSSNYQKMAANALHFEEVELSRVLASHGVEVINWDPTKQDIVQTALATVK